VTLSSNTTLTARLRGLLLNGLLNCKPEVLLLPRHLKCFWVGLLIYTASFFLVGAAGPGPAPGHGSRGYFWAWWSLAIPWLNIDLWSQGAGSILMSATAVVGLINPVFILTVLALVKRYRRPFVALRIVLLVMFPFCLVPFVLFGFHPREGCALWGTGMLLVVFSDQSAGNEGVSVVRKAW